MLLRWGICGAGMISSDFANALQLATDRHALQAVAARALPRAQEFAAKYNVAKAHGSYADLARDPDVDVIYVGTVNNTHYELCKLFLEAGKPVLCEKALCCSAKQTEAVIEIAKKRGIFLMEAMWSRTLPAYAKLRQLLKENAIGSVRAVQMQLIVNKIELDRISNAELGGGVMRFSGVYGLALIDTVFSGVPLERVHAVGAVQNGVESDVCATFQFAGNRFASMLHSATIDGDIAAGHASATIFGSAGHIRLLPAFPVPSCIEVTSRVASGEPSTERFTFTYPKGPQKDYHYGTGGLLYEADHVLECLTNGLKESPLVSLDYSLKTEEIIDDIHRQLGLQPLAAMSVATV